ncbi:pitrilysin family protein [Seohaeicola sp. SP36]|uniref:M16 family metallopeptidase n=1 Tax=unclassified Seohaeicola TaxID=2641111 RepID=UPI00237BF383|nr:MULTISPECIES: pitrilysin family protein [unclassified Seohaeicola]MDD9706549.1 pitrilysin family protein [Seohaeicola sp. 4SK31]MDD9734255.1 pitrilysin family protein [Seohaeicola sp. SP36]
MMRFILPLMLALAALPARAAIEIKEVVSPGGITAWLVEDHTIPFTALEVRFRGGASVEPMDKRGATNLMTALLEEGAGEMDARAFARARDGLAASFRYSVSDDALSVSAQFLTENRDAAVDLLRQSLIQPRFDAEAIERVRAQVLSGLRSDEKNPQSIAARRFDGLIFGDHPYASSLDGTIETVSALTRDDLRAAHAATLARDRIYVSAVGDITEAELGTLLDKLLGDLPATGAAMPGPADPVFPGGVDVVDFPTPQSVVLFGQPGVGQEAPDFFAAFILDHILGGGGFESRLMTEVREKRGLTYGIYTYLADRDHAQTWGGSVASANDRVAEAVDVIRAEWTRLQTEGVTAEELENAKTYLTGAYPLRFDGNGTIANIIVGMQMRGLPIDYAATRNDKVNAVTLEDVNRVAREVLDPAALSFVVVGQPEGLTGTSN